MSSITLAAIASIVLITSVAWGVIQVERQHGRATYATLILKNSNAPSPSSKLYHDRILPEATAVPIGLKKDKVRFTLPGKR